MNKKMKSSNDPNMLGKLGKWNWGAFGFGFLWAISNVSVSSAVLIFIVSLILSKISFIASLIVPIYLGIKGNDLAWQNKDFSGVEEFKRIQSGWAKSFAIVCPIICILFFFLVYLQS